MRWTLASLAALASGGLLALVTARPAPKAPWVKPTGFGHPGKRDGVAVTTSTSNVTTTSAPSPNLWHFFSNDEAADVISYLHNQTALNLTAAADAGYWDNYILVVDVLPPAKKDVAAFLDGNGTRPERWAQVSIMYGATDEPYVQQYVVGPLPTTEGKTGYYPDTSHTRAEDAKIRVYMTDETYDFVAETAANMSDILMDLGNYTQEQADAGYWYGPDYQETQADGSIKHVNWNVLWLYPAETTTANASFTFDASTLFPQGVFLKFDFTGRDPSAWSLMGILYAGVYYDSAAAFAAAYNSSGFVRATPNSPVPQDAQWVKTDQYGDELPLETLPPPQNVQPAGNRFKVDDAEDYIEWMDFSFYLTFTRDTGLRFYDIKYKGERILYELGLDEAIAHYAGADPIQSFTAYLDSFYGFGLYAFSMLPGFDIPDYAYCINSTFHAAEVSKTHRCGIAVFEADQNYLMQRHSSDEYISATKNPALTVRSVSTVGNYDYSFDFNFGLDGTIETTVRASGYIQSAYYANNTEYGYQIQSALSGSLHDHVLNFKADFDILGTANTMVKHTVVQSTEQYPWSPNPVNTMKLAKEDVEVEAGMRWSANAQEMVLIVNKDEPNAWGEERGYRLMPSKGAGMHLTIQNSSVLLDSANFATDAYYVLRQSDDELKSVSAWNTYDPANPLVDFGDFLNGESTVQEDLVVYFNLGMHHVPHTGDLPNTVFTTAQSGMVITPHNYLLDNPSRASTQMIRIVYSADNVTEVDTFGSQSDVGTLDLAQTAWDPWTYAGDVATRKYPYDPLNPYNDTESIA